MAQSGIQTVCYDNGDYSVNNKDHHTTGIITLRTRVQQSGFYLLSDNRDALIARRELTEHARTTLDIQYYIFHNDASGHYLAHYILQAAERKVKVRILVDDINMAGRDSAMKLFSQHPNISIKIFNPLLNRGFFRQLEFIINLRRAGKRMHNKVFISDNEEAIIGGRNIGDEYFDARHTMNFVDLDVLCTGAITQHIAQSFNDYWNSQLAIPIEKISRIKILRHHLLTFKNKFKDKWRKIKNTDYFKTIDNTVFSHQYRHNQLDYSWATASFFYDRPEKITASKILIRTRMGQQLLPCFEQAQSELLIATPYFVPGKSGVAWFHKMIKKGIAIHVLTNSLAATDVKAVHAGYKKYRPALLAIGVKLYELKATALFLKSKTRRFVESHSRASLHAKYMVMDKTKLFVGSANLDPRSELLNTEVEMVIHSPMLAQQAAKLFDKTRSADNSYALTINPASKKLNWSTRLDQHPVYYNHEPNAGLLTRLGIFLLSLLPIESLL